ncbi:scopoletin glucosyltransferase-like [Macadamia integrifolia]|uniref:scopoletin glucosyltransferase-like n=1 Tax=Macadamia integrifolia TaxID=60698 RepID=UPI001C500C6D|nr:scopoletin glucosyltransferase-like [Macadamia integrifolia]
MDTQAPNLDMLFLPFLTPGHMLPMVNLARLLAARGVKATIVTTPSNAVFCSSAIDEDTHSGLKIRLHILRFPFSEVGLPQGVENFYSINSLEMAQRLYTAVTMLQQPIEQLIRELRPQCIVSDMFFPWTSDLAAELGTQRLFFDGMGFFSHCVSESLRLFTPHEKVQSDTEPFLVPGLPDRITMTRSQLPPFVNDPNSEPANLMNQIRESELQSYGVVVNSFYELEPNYVEHFKKVLGRKVWHVGPVALVNRKTTTEKVKRGEGHGSSSFFDDCLKWLDSMEPKSVLYVCFGTSPCFLAAQLGEIESGLEASGHPFIWVLRKEKQGRWLPEGVKERAMEEVEVKKTTKGLIITGWVPQVVILNHRAIGGFLTHCGWNSILEGVGAGVPMITWPVSSEQFYNEKLVTQVLRIGIAVGAKMWSLFDSDGEIKKETVKKGEIEKAVIRLMMGDGGGGEGEEVQQMRTRAREMSFKAKRAMEEGGSSYFDLTALINDLNVVAARHHLH